MKDIHSRPFRQEDSETLDKFRAAYPDADLETPHGYAPEGIGVETVVAEKDGHIVSALTATMCVVLDPNMRNPEADPLTLMKALTEMEAIHTYNAQRSGAVDSYVAIPNCIADTYGKILEKHGYKETIQNCKVYRRPLVPDNVTEQEVE